MNSRRPRSAVELSRDLNTEFVAAADRMGVTRSALAIMAVIDCARIAEHVLAAERAGTPHDNPLPIYEDWQRVPGTGDPGRIVVRWAMAPAYLDRCRILIEDAGSTMTLAVGWWVSRLIAAGGDPLALDLAPKSAYAAAA